MSRDPIEERGGANLYGFVKNRPAIIFDILGQIYYEQKCPDPTWGKCYTRVGKTIKQDSGWKECTKTDKALIWGVLTLISIEYPGIGLPADGVYSTCCKCQIRKTWNQTPVREWKGKLIIYNGTFGVGQNTIHAAIFEGLGPIVQWATEMKRYWRIVCGDKIFNLPTDDLSMGWGKNDLKKLPEFSFNVGEFDVWIENLPWKDIDPDLPYN